MSNGDFTDFLDALRAFESGVDYDRYRSGQITEWQIRSWVGDANWNAYQAGQMTWRDMQYTSVNALGFVGYQFGEPLLIDLGYYSGNTGNKWTGTFTGKNGVDSFAELKTDIQEAIILDAFGYNLNVIESGLEAKGTTLDAIIGTTRTYKDTNGQDVSVTLTLTGILAAAHLRGAWGTLDLLNNGSASADEYGTSILKYIEKFGGYDTPSYSTLIAAHTSGKTLAFAEELWHDDFNNDGVVLDYSGWDGTQNDGGSDGGGDDGDGDDGDTGGDDGNGGDGVATVTAINWAWGTNTVLAFEPSRDVLDFGWFQAANFSLAEVNGSVIITIEGNNQTYKLDGVSLSELSMTNIRAKDASAVAEWDAAFDSAVPAGPTLAIGDVSLTEGNAGSTQMVFTITLSKAATGPVTVNYATADGTATAGTDYAATSGTLTFAAGQTTKTVSVAINGDTAVETSESFTLKLTNASGATIADASATGTITNDDVAPPAISIADLTVTEGNGDHVHFMFTVTLDKPAAGPVTVAYATANGTATAGSDYVAGSGTITFAAGETTKTIHVDILGDTVVEANETFTVNLTNAYGATIADGSATGTIANDDVVAALPAITISDMAVAEGNGAHVHFMFTVTLDKAATGPVTVNYSTANGTATAGSDYVAGSGTVTFAAGETSKTIHVDIVGDTLVEANETFTVNLSNASGATIADATAIGTITNDDGAPAVPTIAVADVSMREGNSGAAEMMFIVTLSQAATGPVTVAYSTANGTASAGSDYTALSGTLTFAAGETSKMIHVMVGGDTTIEASETFTLNLSNAVGATIADASAIGTITDDDTIVDPTGPGKTYTITSLSAADVVGFNPATDVIDLGNANIHSFIIIDTPQGVGFASPWNSETVIIQGVRLADLTVDNFAYIDNNHLREALSGALAWENGPALEDDTVYMRSHEVGQVDRVAFDPDTDTVSFKYYGSREQLSMTDSAEGVVIADGTTGQKLILLGVKTADLSVSNFEFTFTQVREDDLSNKIGMGNAPTSQIVDFDIPIAGGGTVAGASGSTGGVTGEDGGDGGGDDDHEGDGDGDHDHEDDGDDHDHDTDPCPEHSGHVGNGVADTTAVTWAWGTNKVVNFDTALDTLDFNWMGKDSFSLAEVNGSTVITIQGNNQTYTLTDVSLVELTMTNIAAKDAGAVAEWTAALEAAKAASDCECCAATTTDHDHMVM